MTDDGDAHALGRAPQGGAPKVAREVQCTAVCLNLHFTYGWRRPASRLLGAPNAVPNPPIPRYRA